MKKNPSGVEVKFIGNHKNQPVLELHFNNATEGEYTIEIVDEFNVLLYKDVVKSNAGVRRFMLNTEELGNVGLVSKLPERKATKLQCMKSTAMRA
ncbi:MAG: hypothetical protein NVV59_06355 [Chitinophagaceae bacterium]|nr:hypothetical protein [Chitinophagaceae bacterium]